MAHGKMPKLSGKETVGIKKYKLRKSELFLLAKFIIICEKYRRKGFLRKFYKKEGKTFLYSINIINWWYNNHGGFYESNTYNYRK